MAPIPSDASTWPRRSATASPATGLPRPPDASTSCRMTSLTTIGFDADDTLWQNEHFYRLTLARFAGLLGEYATPEAIARTLLESEKRNLAFYGYGIKGFTLSMIETAIEVTEGRAPASVIAEILNAGREMLRHPVETLPHVRAT